VRAGNDGTDLGAMRRKNSPEMGFDHQSFSLPQKGTKVTKDSVFLHCTPTGQQMDNHHSQ
jgi:hypothetical protein